MSTWTRFAADVPEAAGEGLAARLGLEGYAVEVQDQDTLARPEPGRVKVVVYAEPGREAELLAAVRDELEALERRGLLDDRTRLDEAPCEEQDWRDLWKRYWRPEPVGKHLLVRPSFREAPADGRVVVTLDPGRAFGTGGHASTRLCLLAIDAALEAGRTPRSVLDVGTGSGILAIAAALAWPDAAVVATDIDPDALEVAAENAARNGASDRIELRADVPPAAFDLVLANIQMDAHLALAETLAAAVAPGGHLVLAGLLTEQGGLTAVEFAQRGLSWRAHVVDARDPMWCAEQLSRS